MKPFANRVELLLSLHRNNFSFHFLRVLHIVGNVTSVKSANKQPFNNLSLVMLAHNSRSIQNNKVDRLFFLYYINKQWLLMRLSQLLVDLF